MPHHGRRGVCTTLRLHDQYSVVLGKKGHVQHKQKVVSSAYAVETAAQWNSNATGKIIHFDRDRCTSHSMHAVHNYIARTV